jgi:adenylate cyclase
MNFKQYYSELKRRNVIKSALAYLVVTWVITQVLTTVLPTFDAPEYIAKTIIVILVVGFPLWLIFSWVYEITPEGIKKTANIIPDESITPQTSNRLNKIIIGALGVAIVLLAINLFKGNEVASSTVVEESAEESAVNDKSIAVLAFADMSPEKDQEYFSDGISEEILNLLAKVPELKVISRTSSFSYKDKNVTTEVIGKELGVGYVLEGSVRKSGNTFRITTQLINTNTGAHIWSETYDHDMQDIFEIQDRIAAVVTRQLKVTLLDDNIFRTKTINPEAYDLFLQASRAQLNGTEQDVIRAEKLINQSIAIDSSYAPSYSLKSFIISSGNSFSIRPFNEEISEAKIAANKAIELDSTLVFGYTALSNVNRREWDFENASKNMKIALELAPDNSGIIMAAAREAESLGKIDYAITLVNKGLDIDPLNYSGYFRLASLYSDEEEYKKAEAALKKYLFMYEDNRWSHNFLAQIYLGQGEIEKAMQEIEQDTDPFWRLHIESMIVYASGNTEKADKLLKKLVDDWGHDSMPNIAIVYAFRNEVGEAFDWLEQSYDVKDPSLFSLLNTPAFKNLHGDPRWNVFINKLGLPEDHGYHLD